MNQSELPFKMFQISTMSLSSMAARFFFLVLVYVGLRSLLLNMSEFSQLIHGLRAPAARPPLQLEHRPLPVNHNKVTKFYKSCLHDRNHQEFICHKGPRHFSFLGGLSLCIQHSRDNERIHHIHGKSVKHAVYVAFQPSLLCYFATFSKLELEVCKLLC